MTALWLRTTLRKELLGHPRAMPGVWGGLRLIAYSHGKSSWGAKPIVPPSAAPSRPVNLGLGDLVLIVTCLYTAVW